MIEKFQGIGHQARLDFNVCYQEASKFINSQQKPTDARVREVGLAALRLVALAFAAWYGFSAVALTFRAAPLFSVAKDVLATFLLLDGAIALKNYEKPGSGVANTETAKEMGKGVAKGVGTVANKAVRDVAAVTQTGWTKLSNFWSQPSKEEKLRQEREAEQDRREREKQDHLDGVRMNAASEKVKWSAYTAGTFMHPLWHFVFDILAELNEWLHKKVMELNSRSQE